MDSMYLRVFQILTGKGGIYDKMQLDIEPKSYLTYLMTRRHTTSLAGSQLVSCRIQTETCLFSFVEGAVTKLAGLELRLQFGRS